MPPNPTQPNPSQAWPTRKGKDKNTKWVSEKVKFFLTLKLFALPLLEFFSNPRQNQWSIFKVCSSAPSLNFQSIDSYFLVDYTTWFDLYLQNLHKWCVEKVAAKSEYPLNLLTIFVKICIVSRSIVETESVERYARFLLFYFTSCAIDYMPCYC